MTGIDLNAPVLYRHASLRFFKEREHHITRVCPDNVLLLVYRGVLRFSEEGVEREVCAGEYYIQRKNLFQDGAIASDAPEYLYVHFDAEWGEHADTLAPRGSFDVELLHDLMLQIDRASYQKKPYNELQYLFLKLLLQLRKTSEKAPIAEALAEFIERNLHRPLSLSDLCEEFHYSKNYVIRIFNEAFGVTPICYINEVKLNRAMYLLETTSKPVGEVAAECGYTDYPYFYKRFIQRTGVSPVQWRRQMQVDPLHKYTITLPGR